MALIATPPLCGIQLGLGIDGIGQLKILGGAGDPNDAATDSTAGDLASAAVGSLFLRMDGSTSTSLYVKTTFTQGGIGTWTAK
jgi:hypothetical protein